MVMFSQLRRFMITDEQGRQAKLNDLSVELLEGDHPHVTCLFFVGSKRQKCSIRWEQVQSIDWQARVIKVADLSEAKMNRQSP